MEDKLGKIDHPLFTNIIRENCGYPRKDVLVGPGFGVDVSVVRLPGGMAMATTSDPLSLIPSLGLEESAWLSVHLMANDMATTGFAPMYGQFVLNLPATFSKEDFKTYWQYIHQYCANVGVAITGGHTGFIEGQNSTIAGGGTFTTIAPQAQILTSQNARPGDTILVTKQCALSSTSILAMSFPETVKNKLGQETYQKACDMFYQTSSLKDALTAVGAPTARNQVTAMHDVTEGGVLGAIYELASASGNGAVIFNDQIPIGNIQQDVCSLFSIDPRYCVGAGSMVITCKKEAAHGIIAHLAAEGIACCAVGEIRERESGIKLIANGEASDLVYLAEDPYWAAFFNAFREGWK
ncbi:AIR synthase family protein [Rufibacter quisquiliarum]|uniref:Hydrogenase maturation factor n=1 Tax=Rufibacter quisquiliarum TaxID=1549639 RepID=A0A839GGG2_9BACT|nr:AIR synthase family protein [Rufibacter quisquiliarum]MBA9077660.1 hydrogenase maturation factor [Rufibacter quisquiliarum]